MLNHYICTVCGKRWGLELDGSELVMTKCEKHLNTLTSAEIVAKGLTAGKYLEMKIRRMTSRPVGRPKRLGCIRSI